MKIFIDTRQKKEQHKNIDNYFLKNNIEIEHVALDVGDYKLSIDGKISVDTKQNVYELVSNLFSKKEVARFQRECKRAQKSGTTLYILIEEAMTKEKLLNWKAKKGKDGDPITRVTGKQIYHKMQIYTIIFGVKWRFCRKSETGKTIFKLLGGK